MERWVTGALLFVSLFNVYAQDKTELDQLMDMSLQELMDIVVTIGTITGSEYSKVPASVTIITSSDIAMTPSRNILDLIDVYVPGALFVNHWLGPRIGMRGISSDQNNSFLVLVNGKDMNMKSMNGAIFEIQNKDINDINRIEIIRGPGSVIYGPGAIGGIINIITKNSTSGDGLSMSAEGNLNYCFANASLSYGFSDENFEGYFYGSISRSEGEKNPDYYYIDRAHGYGYGFMNEDWGNYGYGTPPPHLYEDFLNRPELKLHFDLSFIDDWHFWGRFTTFNYTSLQQQTKTADGPSFPGLYGSNFAIQLSKRSALTENLTLNSSADFSSQSHRHYLFYQGASQPFQHPAQRNYSFAENSIQIKSKLLYDFEKTNIAIAADYRYRYFSPEWGLDKSTFLMPFPSPLKFVVLDSSSVFHQTYGSAGFTTIIEEQIDGSAFSIAGELQHEFGSKFNLLLSFRADKHSYSDWAFSPRLAVVSELNKRNTVKLIFQRSVRFSNFTELYTEYEISGRTAQPEILNSIELIYDRLESAEINLNASVYYNSVDQIGWADVEEYNDVIGNFQLLGLESEVRWRGNNLQVGLNYSFIHQLKWKQKLDTEAWITSLDGEKIYISNFGANRINNLPKHAFKFFANFNLFGGLKLHANARLYWDYQQKEMLNLFEEAHLQANDPVTIDELNKIINDIESYGYAKPSFTSNISLGWEQSLDGADLSFQLYAMNLITYNHIRYVFQFWERRNLRQYPRHSSFTEEPLTIGFRLGVKF